MNSYTILKQQRYTSGDYAIVPIRMEDRHVIMKWRNEQMYHLRQNEPLTPEKQDHYFSTVIMDLFKHVQPGQILFSYLQNGKCIGYGGLVHINWWDRNAEISFIMNSELESENFELHWSTFLNLLYNVAFEDLEFHKLFVYAFDLRPHLYLTLEKNGFFKDAVLTEHCYFGEKFIDVVIYSKFRAK